MPQPQLIEIDPQKIKFNPENPRMRVGSDYLSLKKSIQEVGQVLVPVIVRTRPGGFYETIDGESRTRVAQELRLPTIRALNFGVVDDIEALTFLHVSNVVRSYNFLAQCKGYAALHRRGLSSGKIAMMVGEDMRYLQPKISIGYFPDAILTRIQEDIAKSEERAKLWGYALLSHLAPLRQVLPGKAAPGTLVEGHKNTPSDWAEIEGVYDYTEVARAVEQIIKGEINSVDQLKAHVEERRRILFEQRFNEEMRLRLEQELAQTKQALETSYLQQLQGVQQQTAERYEAQVNVLRQQYEELEKQYQKVVRDVAKRPEVIAEREQQLQERLKATELERTRFQTLQNQVQSEVQKTQQEARAAIQKELSEAVKAQQRAMEEQLKQARADMEAYYAQRDQQRQLQAEKSVRQTVAHGTELLSQTQQWILHLTASGFIKGVSWLPEAEVTGLLAQIMAVQQTLTDAMDAIRHGDGSVIVEERKTIHG